MRIIVFFDLPTLTYLDRREYTKFRKFLIKNGFLMLQESVYCKLALNGTVSEAIIKKIKKNRPSEGLVQILSITEKQFSRMEMVTGTFSCDVLDTDERLVIL